MTLHRSTTADFWASRFVSLYLAERHIFMVKKKKTKKISTLHAFFYFLNGYAKITTHYFEGLFKRQETTDGITYMYFCLHIVTQNSKGVHM